jgi:hypothetical protein
VLAGRSALLENFDVVRRRAEEYGEGDRSWILNGLRGVGKTVLLNELQGQVSGRGWITAKIEGGAQQALPAALSQAFVRGLRTATGRHPEPTLRHLLGVLKAFSVKVNPAGVVALGVDVDLVGGVADSGAFADDLAALFEVLGETARELGIGVLILVDELQEASQSELTAINTAVHALGQADTPLPVIFVGAGLPSLPAQLADATSYAERLWDYRTVGPLREGESRDALLLPAQERDVDWSEDGLALAVDRASGYPYFLQAVGKHVWDYAKASPIGVDDVRIGLDSAREEVDEGLYKSRWERATPGQRDLMRHIATLGGTEAVAMAELTTAMGKRRTSDLSVARNDLIKKGLVYAPERGLLAFTVHGMHEFISRQH